MLHDWLVVNLRVEYLYVYLWLLCTALSALRSNWPFTILLSPWFISFATCSKRELLLQVLCIDSVLYFHLFLHSFASSPVAFCVEFLVIKWVFLKPLTFRTRLPLPSQHGASIPQPRFSLDWRGGVTATTTVRLSAAPDCSQIATSHHRWQMLPCGGCSRMEQSSNQCHNSYFPLLLQETIKNISFHKVVPRTIA